MSQFLDDVRKEYQRGSLSEADIDSDPMAVFDAWLTAAVAAGLREPNGMTLATVSAAGRPAARVVLLKGFDARGFVFFTNYESRKGRELAETPYAALTFWWGELERQVRIEGHVTQLEDAESDAYYASRPHGAQLGAWVSPQSRVIPDRALLEQRLAALEQEYAGRTPARPPSWGGYRVKPEVIEFWQGGLHRLHDRLRFTRQPAGDWKIERLAP